MSLPWWTSATAVPFQLETRLITPHFHQQRYSHTRLSKSSHSSSSFTAPKAILLDEVVQLSHNKVLVAAGVSAAIGQLAKPFTSVIFYGREFNFRTAFEAGGFPSTHSSAVVAAATILGVERGLADSIFGITVVYASLIIYDAQGVRREVGKHAKAINTLLRTKTPMNSSIFYKAQDQDPRVDSQLEKRISPAKRTLESSSSLQSEEGTEALMVPTPTKKDTASSSLATDVEEESRMEGSHCKAFKESIGHTEIEVAAGALLGLTVSLITNTLL